MFFVVEKRISSTEPLAPGVTPMIAILASLIIVPAIHIGSGISSHSALELRGDCAEDHDDDAVLRKASAAEPAGPVRELKPTAVC